jgi:dTDP-glucose 4,6-dehydratase
MNILITGVAGFIGSNFAYYILDKSKKDYIIGLDALKYSGNLENIQYLIKNETHRFKFIFGDITSKKLVTKIFQKFNIDIVVNFAAESHVDRSILDSTVFIRTNVIGTQNLLEVAKNYWIDKTIDISNKRFIQISTDEVYGSLETNSSLFTENTPINPHNPYSASKASADLITKAYSDTYNLPINIIRCSNNYGPYQFPEKLIPLTIINCLSHKNIPIYGDGKNIREWTYVEDHCNAIHLIIEKGSPSEIYNVGSRSEIENIELVKKIIELLALKNNDKTINTSLIQFVRDRPSHDRRYGIDPSKIRSQLAWKPKFTFLEGLDNTISWYLNNRRWIEKTLSKEYLLYYKKNYDRRKDS